MDDMDMEEKTMMQKAMMPGNQAFLGVAVEHAVMAGLTLFRYNSSSTYYDDGNIMSFNAWKVSNLIEQWTGLVLGSVLGLSQLLSMFGVGASVNMMMWGWSTMLVMPLAMGVAEVMRFWAYDQSYQICEDSSSADQATGCALMDTLEWEMIVGAVKEIGAGLMLDEASEAWMHAQFMQLTEEQQKAAMEMHKMEKEKMESDYEKMMDDDMETFAM